MTFIPAEAIGRWEERYGTPRCLGWEWPAGPQQVAGVRASQKHGRAHDITLFIFRGPRLALIRKHHFGPGVFRAPSGGLEPGEDLEAGASREAWEETGLSIRLVRYLLRVQVRFASPQDFVDWTTHVFSAKAVSGRLQPVDRHEIAGARYATVEELQGPIREALLRSGRPLLAYRVALTDAAVAELGRADGS